MAHRATARRRWRREYLGKREVSDGNFRRRNAQNRNEIVSRPSRNADDVICRFDQLPLEPRNRVFRGKILGKQFVNHVVHSDDERSPPRFRFRAIIGLVQQIGAGKFQQRRTDEIVEERVYLCQLRKCKRRVNTNSWYVALRQVAVVVQGGDDSRAPGRRALHPAGEFAKISRHPAELLMAEDLMIVDDSVHLKVATESRERRSIARVSRSQSARAFGFLLMR